jgi:hypothetical protein
MKGSKQMKPLTPSGLAALLHVGRGRDIPEAEVAAELAGGVLCASFSILSGLIKTGAADGQAMRAYLQSLYDDLGPAERHLAYGFSLSQVIEALDANLPTATPSSLPSLRSQH